MGKATNRDDVTGVGGYRGMLFELDIVASVTALFMQLLLLIDSLLKIHLFY